jgi:DNA-binding IclR family transcriptional regulator
MPAADRTAYAAGQVRARRALVSPFARALSVLEAWTPEDTWLGNFELAQRTGLPTSTVTRIAQSLVQLGYLRHAPTTRKYRLAAAVMALGYGAIANSNVHGVHVILGGRDRLDVIVLESCACAQLPGTPALGVGRRVGIACEPMGWALLAVLPEAERYYLLENVQRREPREWPRLSRRSSEGIAQVQQLGWCARLSEGAQDVATLAVPLLAPDHMPLVLSCVGPARMTRARIERELAPRLLGISTEIVEACTAGSRH